DGRGGQAVTPAQRPEATARRGPVRRGAAGAAVRQAAAGAAGRGAGPVLGGPGRGGGYAAHSRPRRGEHVPIRGAGGERARAAAVPPLLAAGGRRARLAGQRGGRRRSRRGGSRGPLRLGWPAIRSTNSPGVEWNEATTVGESGRARHRAGPNGLS